MRIREIHVKNFRSILDESLSCDCLTALVGRNGAGKSSFLNALEIFYDPSPNIVEEDFYFDDTCQNIEIAITFTDLSNEEKEKFCHYIDDDSLVVVRVLSLPQPPETKGSTAYHGICLQNPEFISVRNAGNATAITRQYNEIRKTGKYSSLPTARSEAKVHEALAQWERHHSEQCSRMQDDGKFFGFRSSVQGNLGRHTIFIRIPAVRDAQDDATEKKGSCITDLMDLAVRSVLTSRKDVEDFKDQTQVKYKEILDADNLKELHSLERDLSATLQSYAPNASVLLQWSKLADIEIPMPRAQIKLLEDGYESAVHRTGHGLQRAFILTMLQHLVAAREAEITAEESSIEDKNLDLGSANVHLPSLVLAIEEPELYQHPSRQRHLTSVLLKLASGTISGVARRTQVIYTTHSPLFVGLDRFDQIRVLRKCFNGNKKPKITRVKEADMGSVACELQQAQGQTNTSFTPETLRPRLQAIMTPWMNEGFFSDIVVLVEGEADRAAILGVAQWMNFDFDSLGITVIPCIGKNNLDRPLVIFRHLGIPVYVVWDGDNNSKPEANRRLLRLLGVEEEQYRPHYVGNEYAYFEKDVETTLANEIETCRFNSLLDEAKKKFGMSKNNEAFKNPAVFQHIVTNADANGKISKSLKHIVEKIVALNT